MSEKLSKIFFFYFELNEINYNISYIYNKTGKINDDRKSGEKPVCHWLLEIYWKNKGHYTLKEGNLILCSVNETDATNGVAFIIHKHW